MTNVMKKVFAEFDSESLEEAMENGMASVLMDSVQPSWCTACGVEGPDLEPDARGVRCDSCGENQVSSLGVIILGF